MLNYGNLNIRGQAKLMVGIQAYCKNQRAAIVVGQRNDNDGCRMNYVHANTPSRQREASEQLRQDGYTDIILVTQHGYVKQ